MKRFFIPNILLLFIVSFILGCKNNKENHDTSQNEMASMMADTTERMANLEFEINSRLGEGAIWNYKTQELYWVDIEGQTLNIYNPKTNKNRQIETPSMIGTVVPKSKTEAVVALVDGIYIVNLENESFTRLSEVEKNIVSNRFNDGKADPSGRLWVGSMAFNQIKGAAKLYMVDKNGSYSIKKDSVTISNGIVWSADKQKMYYIDTPTAQIKEFKYDDITGEISEERIAVNIPQSLGYPDGMTIDNEDKLWVGMWNGNAVIRFDPESGKVLEKIRVPAHNVTSCAFGGDNLDVLYITTASLDMSEEEKDEYPYAGSIFSIKPGVKGVKSNYFGDK